MAKDSELIPEGPEMSIGEKNIPAGLNSAGLFNMRHAQTKKKIKEKCLHYLASVRHSSPKQRILKSDKRKKEIRDFVEPIQIKWNTLSDLKMSLYNNQNKYSFEHTFVCFKMLT